MDQWITNLWTKNKILFFILIPVILIFVFKNLIMEYLVGSLRKRVEEAKKQDAKLEKDFDKINDQADKLREEANQNPTIPDDEDWHKKR